MSKIYNLLLSLLFLFCIKCNQSWGLPEEKGYFIPSDEKNATQKNTTNETKKKDEINEKKATPLTDFFKPGSGFKVAIQDSKHLVNLITEECLLINQYLSWHTSGFIELAKSMREKLLNLVEKINKLKTYLQVWESFLLQAVESDGCVRPHYRQMFIEKMEAITNNSQTMDELCTHREMIPNEFDFIFLRQWSWHVFSFWSQLLEQIFQSQSKNFLKEHSARIIVDRLNIFIKRMQTAAALVLEKNAELESVFSFPRFVPDEQLLILPDAREN